jgi:serine/threonine protein kinase
MAQRTQPTIGDTLAGYRIDASVGSGGMGEVYRAFDTRLNRNVALKLLAPRLADDEGFRGRFLRESLLAASLDHPSVVPVYEAGEAEGRLFIAMRFVEGTDLRHLLDSEPPRVRSTAAAAEAATARALAPTRRSNRRRLSFATGPATPSACCAASSSSRHVE